MAREEKRGGEDSASKPMAALAALPRLLTSARDDIRTIAEGMAVLPELARILASIEGRVERIEDEVAEMRRAVDSMGSDVGGLPDRLDELHDAIPLSRRRRQREQSG